MEEETSSATLRAAFSSVTLCILTKCVAYHFSTSGFPYLLKRSEITGVRPCPIFFFDSLPLITAKLAPRINFVQWSAFGERRVEESHVSQSKREGKRWISQPVARVGHRNGLARRNHRELDKANPMPGGSRQLGARTLRAKTIR